MAKTDKTNHAPGGSRRLELVTLAIALGLAAAAPAGAAVSTEKRLISPQYQAKSADTAARVAGSVHTGFQRHEASPAAWYRMQNTRYQLHDDSILRSNRSFPGMNPKYRANSASLLRPNHRQITPQIDKAEAISSSDARLLLRLGLGLGLGYVVFLAAWFWRTRNRTQSTARLVRF